MKVLKVIELMLIVLLLISCRTGDEEPLEEKIPAVINVYVYAPDHPIVTRGDVGEVAPIDNTTDNTTSESEIKTLQIWVFNHTTGDRIAYYSPESVADLNNSNHGVTYQLSTSEAFTQAAENEKPPVDVYVLANVASCGLTFGENTTQDQLEDAVIGNSYFGLSSLTTKVPSGGLPMSGVLRGEVVTGAAPVYKISTVKLTRAVSKLRFVFCREIDEAEKAETPVDKPVQIKKITLDALHGEGNPTGIPTQEYLFLMTEKYRIGGSYEGVSDFLTSPLSDIAKNDDPIKYTYQGQEAQEYEDLIDEGLKTTTNEQGATVPPELTQVGPFYLRESDQLLTGSITYQKEGKDESTATFEMHAAGDFSRNHTWIVYAYYGNSGLEVISVYVKDWIDNTDKSHSVYNW